VEATLAVVEAAARGVPPAPEALLELLHTPAAAAAVLSWVRSAMGDPDHYRQVRDAGYNRPKS
jgi:negative elongation factor C/D